MKNRRKYLILLLASLVILILILQLAYSQSKKADTTGDDIANALATIAALQESDSSSCNETVDSISCDSALDNSISTNDIATPYVDISCLESGCVIDASLVDFDHLEDYFLISEIDDNIYSYINGKTYRDNNNISLADLRYIKLIHYNYNHDIQVGELIVNKKVTDEFVDIFKELFVNEYEIEKMYLPDRYWTGDCHTTDDASCDDNNTSAFFYRTAESSGNISNHAYGMAIDINPQQNPYVSLRGGIPNCAHENAMEYLDRASGKPHMITKDDLCYQLFIAHGYSWGGAWTHSKDYQHFEKK